jgi:hypothetical protein
MCWDPLISFMLSSVLIALTCFFRYCSKLMIYSTHLDESVTCVKTCTVIMSLCTFFGSWIVCMIAWITDARRMVIEASLSIASTENETVPITAAAWRSPGYKYLLHFPLGTILHSFSSSLFCLGFPSLVLYFLSYPGSKRVEPKPLYVCLGCSNHTYSNNMINI